MCLTYLDLVDFGLVLCFNLIRLACLVMISSITFVKNSFFLIQHIRLPRILQSADSVLVAYWNNQIGGNLQAALSHSTSEALRWPCCKGGLGIFTIELERVGLGWLWATGDDSWEIVFEIGCFSRSNVGWILGFHKDTDFIIGLVQFLAKLIAALLVYCSF